VYAVLIVLRFLDKPFVVDNNDHYKELFTDFLHQGFTRVVLAALRRCTTLSWRRRINLPKVSMALF
jgi:hypothetical protein